MKIIKYILILAVLIAIGISIWYFVFVSELSNKGKIEIQNMSFKNSEVLINFEVETFEMIDSETSKTFEIEKQEDNLIFAKEGTETINILIVDSKTIFIKDIGYLFKVGA